MSQPLSRHSGRPSALPYPPLSPFAFVILAWSSGNRFRGGPVLVSPRASFLELLIALAATMPSSSIMKARLR
jgi:hypothetical protein